MSMVESQKDVGGGEPLDIAASYARVRPSYVAHVDLLVNLVNALLSARGIEAARVEGRAKSLDSLKAKVDRKRNYEQLEDIPDLAGLRVICFYQQDVKSVRELVESEFVVREIVAHDGGKSPGSFGYASTHLVVEHGRKRKAMLEYASYKDLACEIQIRTVLQDAWAMISHKLNYKVEAEIPSEVQRLLFRAAALVETSDDLFDRFRQEVANLRAQYAVDLDDEVRADMLEINRDTVRQLVESVDTERVTQMARVAGFAEGGEELSTMREPGVDRLVEALRVIGARTIAPLKEVTDNLNQSADTLRALVEAIRAESNGWAPSPVPEDVLILLLALHSGEESLIGYLESERLNRHIVAALKKLVAKS